MRWGREGAKGAKMRLFPIFTPLFQISTPVIPDFYPVIRAFYPVIPAKAGI